MIANQHDVTLIVEDAVEQLDAAGAVSRTEALTLLRDESRRLLDAGTLAEALKPELNVGMRIGEARRVERTP